MVTGDCRSSDLTLQDISSTKNLKPAGNAGEV